MGSLSPTMQDALASISLKQPIQKAWWPESSVYQIYPASFCSSSPSVPYGNLRGIISKLDYIKSLGVDIVWLSPILQSPQVDMGYDISDYRKIDSIYGSMEDHDDLIRGLHQRGLKYVMDLVVNHTSDQHIWFQASKLSKQSSYRDWYYWRPAKYDTETGERMPPNNWGSAFGGSAWEWDETTQEYYLHIFAKEQPDLNWENPKVVEAVHDIIRFWLEKGVDGFRMDVINFISKNPELPDGRIVRPGFLQNGVEHFACGPRLHEFFRGIGKILKEYDAFSVGEMPGVTDTREILKAVGQDRGELAMAFHFEIMDMDHTQQGRWWHRDFNVKELKTIVSKWQRSMLDNGGWNALYMENHDQGRTISRFCDDSPKYRTKSAKLLASHLALQSGTVFIYQGQELAQVNLPREWGLDEYKDVAVVNHWKTVMKQYPQDLETQEKFKKQYWLASRDNARTPMQWTSEETTYAGFFPTKAEVKPWMSIHPDFKEWNAETLVKDDNSAFNYWRRLLQFRKEHKDIFVYGDFEMLDPDHEAVVAYVRSVDSETPTSGPSRCVVIDNFCGKEVWWTVPGAVHKILFNENGLKTSAIVTLLGNYVGEGQNEVRKIDEGWSIRLRPWEAVVGLN